MKSRVTPYSFWAVTWLRTAPLRFLRPYSGISELSPSSPIAAAPPGKLKLSVQAERPFPQRVFWSFLVAAGRFGVTAPPDHAPACFVRLTHRASSCTIPSRRSCVERHVAGVELPLQS